MARELPCIVNQRIIKTTEYPYLQDLLLNNELLCQLSQVVCLLTRGHLKLTTRGGWNWHPLYTEDLDSLWQEVSKYTA